MNFINKFICRFKHVEEKINLFIYDFDSKKIIEKKLDIPQGISQIKELFIHRLDNDNYFISLRGVKNNIETKTLLFLLHLKTF